MDKLKKYLDNENYGPGLRATLIVVLAILLAASICMFSKALPKGMRGINLLYPHINSITDETEELLSGLTKDVEIIYAVPKGQEEDCTERLLSFYDKASEHIKLSQLDTSYDFLELEKIIGSSKLENSAVIVRCGERLRILNFSDYIREQVFVLEDYLNAGIRYVIGDTNHHAYIVIGHDEQVLTETVRNCIGLDGFEIEDIRLLDGIPTDCDVLVLNGPQKDITETEANILIDYLSSGGKLLLSTAYTQNLQKNIQKVTEFFGAKLGSGVILEADTDRQIDENPLNMMPVIYTTGDDAITSGVEYVCASSSKPIVIDETPGVETQVIMESSETTYSLTQNIFTQENSYENGPFVVGAIFRKTDGQGSTQGKTPTMVWYSSAHLANTALSEYVDGGNVTLFLNTICYLGNDTKVASIYGKTLSSEFLNITDSQVKSLRLVFMIVIPAIVLAIGIAVVLKRRKR